MKRAPILILVLVAGLAGLLYFKLRAQRLAADRASGGSATIEATEVDIVARIGARITALHAAEGQAVAAGTVLLELDCVEPQALLAGAEAGVQGARLGGEGAKVALAAAEQGLANARRQAQAAQAGAQASAAQTEALRVQQQAAAREAERVARVMAAGVSSEQLVDRSASQAEGLRRQVEGLTAAARAAVEQAAVASGGSRSAELQVAAAKVRLAASAAELAAAEANRARAAAQVAECTLRAPRAGVVQSTNYEVGEVVLPGSRLLTLIDLAEVRATFYLPNAELAAARPGAAVQVVPDALPDRRFSGSVRWISSSAEFTPRNVQTREDRDRLVYAVEVAIPNPGGELRPGMPVEVTVPGSARR